MRVYDKLFRRTQARAPLDAAGAAAVPGLPGPQQADAVADSPPADAASPRAVADPAVSAILPRPPVPLRSLSRYQYDPAFAQFQQKLHRPPGTKPSRTRLSPDDYPKREPKRRA